MLCFQVSFLGVFHSLGLYFLLSFFLLVLFPYCLPVGIREFSLCNCQIRESRKGAGMRASVTFFKAADAHVCFSLMCIYLSLVHGH